MKNHLLLFCLLHLSIAFIGQFNVTIEVQLPKSKYDTNETFFIASNKNSWNPKDNKFQILNRVNKSFYKKLVVENEVLEFKITKGSWASVETDAMGNEISNRLYHISSDTVINITVISFKDEMPNGTFEKNRIEEKTRSKQVTILKDSIQVPQLKNKKRIWVYLPKDYNGIKKFPVLYMHDGQNLFDKQTSSYGEWGVDEYLDSALKNCIIVGIEHGGENRMLEYNAYNNKFGKGKGKQYAAFITQTLKPYIDKKFATLKDKQNTFIAGSSMGGLISFYIALQYPKTFGSVGVFSPAFWINLNEIKAEIKNSKVLKNTNFYFYSGAIESKTLLNEVITIHNLTKAKCQGCAINLSIKAQGEHNEKSWQKELPDFFDWLLK